MRKVSHITIPFCYLKDSGCCTIIKFLINMVMKTEFCKFLGKLDKNGNIKIKPLGVAKNNVKNPMLPNWKNVVSEKLYWQTFKTIFKELKCAMGKN